MTGQHRVYIDGELNATFAHASDARIWFRIQVKECPEYEIRLYDEGDQVVQKHEAREI